MPSTPAPDAATAARRKILLRLGGQLFSIVVLVVSVVLVEAALARYFPISDPFARYKIEDRAAGYVPSAHARNYSVRVIAEPDLPGVTGTSTFSTNNVGFRGEPLLLPKPAGEYRIVLIGGSTAECFVLDDTQALHTVLQRRLRERVTDGRVIRVYNAGKAGDKSYDHVALLAHRIVHLQPDLVVVFAGFNDQRAAMLNADYLHLRGKGPHQHREGSRRVVCQILGHRSGGYQGIDRLIRQRRSVEAVFGRARQAREGRVVVVVLAELAPRVRRAVLSKGEGTVLGARALV